MRFFPVFAPKLIILEGADGVGKSTLGRALALKFGGFYFHATATKTLIPAMRDYQTNLMENIEENVAMGRIIVMDRFWPSELIYGAVFRPDNPHGFSHQEMELRCDKLDAIYVCCFSDTAVARHCAGHKDPKHPYDDTSFKKVYEMYEAFYADNVAQPDFVRYHMEVDGANELTMDAFATRLKVAYVNTCERNAP
jgi:thymidylate kinase